MKKFQSLLRRMPLTTAELAKRMGVNQSTISRWGTGQVECSLDNACWASMIIAKELDALGHLLKETLKELELHRATTNT